MNQQHLDLLSSEEWVDYVREDLPAHVPRPADEDFWFVAVVASAS